MMTVASMSGMEAAANAAFVDLKTGVLVHSMTVGGIVEELYDVLMLPCVQRHFALGFKTDDTRRVINIEEEH